MKTATRPGIVRRRQDLKEAEAKACAMLGKYVEIFQACTHHFGTVRRQHEQRELLERHVPKHAVLIQLDYKENDSFPLGPEEAGNWYWATAREAVTTLGFYAVFWKDGQLYRQYWHYIKPGPEP